MKEYIDIFKFLMNFSKNEKKRIITYVILMLLIVAINIIVPILSAKIIVNLTSELYKQLIITALLILLIEWTRNVTRYFANYVSNNSFRNILLNLQIELGNQILKLNNETFDKNGSGVFIQRMINDADKVPDIIFFLTDEISNILRELGILIAIFIINKKIFLLLFISSWLIFIIEKIRLKKWTENFSKFKKSNDSVTGFIGETIRGSRDVKMLNSEKSFINMLKNKIITNNNLKLHTNIVNQNFSLLRGTIADLTDFVMMVLFCVLLIKKEITLSAVLICYNYSSNFANMISMLTSLLDKLKSFSVSANRLKELFDNDVFIQESFGTTHLKKVNGRFEFKDVHFKYKDNKVLKGINFVVNPNETVAFVGKSGAGKTTIFNLLCKMYDNYEGLITIDNHDIKDLDKTSIRGNITIISQNPYIFNLSIKENLKLVKKDLTNKEMIESCKAACLHDFIMSLPEGYDTVIGEGGVNLSGGQKQRLAISRALVQKTEIILFDEATSALDNETQASIQEAINKMKGTYTILIIAHRLSTIINSDRILFIDDGVIKAEGTHKELLKKCPEYKHLYESEISKNK